MRFHDIEVSGIECIVFNRETRFILKDGAGHGGVAAWVRVIPREMQEKCDAGDIGQCLMLHEQMMKIVNALKKDRRYRMWVHFDTLNIVRKERVTPKGCMKCQHVECLVCIPPK